MENDKAQPHPAEQSHAEDIAPTPSDPQRPRGARNASSRRDDEIAALAEKIGDLANSLQEMNDALSQSNSHHYEEIAALKGALLNYFEVSSYGNRAVNAKRKLQASDNDEIGKHRATLSAANNSGGKNSISYRRHLIMPIHPPKVNHLSTIFSRVTSVIDQDVIWTLVVTSPAEREMVERYFQLAKPIVPSQLEVVSALEIAALLGMDDLANAIRENRNGGVINMKKLLAVYRAQCLGAEEICCVDSDVIFLKPLNELFDVCAGNYARQIFIACSSAIPSSVEVILATSRYFSPFDEKSLGEIYQSRLYSWFFDAPYYERSDTADFFNHIRQLYGGIENALSILSWHHFDHILYMNYLLLTGKFQLIDASESVGAGKLTDNLSLAELRIIEARFTVTPAWITLQGLISEWDDAASQGFCAIFHVDRLPSAI